MDTTFTWWDRASGTNPKTDPLKFNLVDPPERNTVIAPVSGWVAIRFKADNPVCINSSCILFWGFHSILPFLIFGISPLINITR